MTTAPQIDYVVYGKIADVEAEYALFDGAVEWAKGEGFRYAVKIIGDAEWDVEFTATKADARAVARGTALALETRVCAI